MRHLIVLVAALTLGGCAAHSAAPPPAEDELYQALGGQSGIERIVEGLLINIADDERIVSHFVDADIDRLFEKLVEQICMESGGPCEYTGDSMEDSHAGMDITEGDFNALVENLIVAMTAEGVPVTSQNRLLHRLAPMRGSIIYR
ncbi:group I truncated hemoglobin [Halopseudomonas salina]|uniref:Group 1 truncated hemoglobin n=1 Tax=Halopseudomonas salina TaxID=1323744 RepID=A0ABQ1PIZ6_9GAMM|nr:group 1 truncated hemoglobin [Halopseudomonas salina]GGC98007.1 group 1 truncated hemoglobin [Halopseudomonas salina]